MTFSSEDIMIVESGVLEAMYCGWIDEIRNLYYEDSLEKGGENYSKRSLGDAESFNQRLFVLGIGSELRHGEGEEDGSVCSDSGLFGLFD